MIYICNPKTDASLAQLVEHDTLNVGVQGSIPWGSTFQKSSDFLNSFFFYPPLIPLPGGTRLRGSDRKLVRVSVPPNPTRE